MYVCLSVDFDVQPAAATSSGPCGQIVRALYQFMGTTASAKRARISRIQCSARCARQRLQALIMKLFAVNKNALYFEIIA
jgi:hypothetical protein